MLGISTIAWGTLIQVIIRFLKKNWRVRLKGFRLRCWGLRLKDIVAGTRSIRSSTTMSKKPVERTRAWTSSKWASSITTSRLKTRWVSQSRLQCLQSEPNILTPCLDLLKQWVDRISLRVLPMSLWDPVPVHRFVLMTQTWEESGCQVAVTCWLRDRERTRPSPCRQRLWTLPSLLTTLQARGSQHDPRLEGKIAPRQVQI